MSTTTEAFAEAWRAPRRLKNAIRMARGELQSELAATPSRVVARWGRVRLLAYEPQGPVTRAPLLMVPSIINRYYVLDLRPGQSLVQHLVEAGVPVYMIDWGTPGPQDRFADMGQHVLGWMHAAVRRACRDAGTETVHLLGYCIGGTLASMYAALRPQRVAGLVALTTPIRFQDEGILTCWTKGGHVPVDHYIRAWGNVSGEFLQGSFVLLQPGASLAKSRTLGPKLWDDAFVERYQALETWVTDSVDVPGEAYRQLVRELYEQDALIEGNFQLRGETVRLEDIRCPVLVVTAARDHIVQPDASAELCQRVSSEDVEHLALPGGHIGVVVGGAARRGLWPALEQWLKDRPLEAAARPGRLTPLN